MMESQVLLTDSQVFFLGFSGFRPPLMNDRLDISELFLKGQCKSYSHFSAKNIRILYIESAKTVNEMTLNELYKLTTL